MTLKLHPATLLVVWVGFVIVLQPLAISGLAWAALVALPVPLLLATRRTYLLIRRARWLLFSITMLFALATPGERLPGAIGDVAVTYDGLRLAAEHVLRLILLLASLALLHEHLGTVGMMAGLHWLLAPLAGWRTLRERIVVRLMLVLDNVETSPGGNWRDWLVVDSSGPDSLNLAVDSLHPLDWAILGLLAVLAVTAAWSV
ncbi:MAG TPA: hypothetical protein VFF82_05640 [Rhodocyclaceae bacterium]|nr:hypothetical protein [Rhodocyclaceae bacterium]